MQKRTGTWSTAPLLLIVSCACFAVAGDLHTINGSIVNIRKGPGIDNPVVLKFRRGRVVEEMGRLDDWVEILTGRSDVESGWVHADLLRRVEPASPLTEEPGSGSEALPAVESAATGGQQTEVVAVATFQASPSFGNFLEKFYHYVELREEETGFIPFTGVQDLGNRIIRVTATDEWLSRSQSYREIELTTLFKMWDKNEGSGSSLSVEIVNYSGEKVMYMHR